MTFHGVVIFVDDIPGVLDFYQRAFGFEVRSFDEKLQYAELESGVTVLAFAAHELGRMLMPHAYERPENGPAGVEIAFATADVIGAFARAVAAGAKPIAEPKRMPWGMMSAYVRSTEGTLVGFGDPTPQE